MPKVLVKSLLVVLACGMILPWIMVSFVPWRVAVLEILATALLGVVVIRYLIARLEQRTVAKLVAGEFLGDALVDAILIFLAGVLLIFPGVISDVAGVLLLIPPVRWLIVGLLRRWNLAHARAMRVEAER